MFDQVLIPASRGKRIIIGGASFNEEQQAEYFRIYGEETRKRGFFVYVFKLVEPTHDPEGNYGLFHPENVGHMNIPKVSANLVKDYLSIPLVEDYLSISFSLWIAIPALLPHYYSVRMMKPQHTPN